MNSRQTTRRRGQPLLALILLMVSWVGARAAMWETPKIVHANPEAAQQALEITKPEPARVRNPVAPRVVPAESKAAPSIPLDPASIELTPVDDPSAPAITPVSGEATTDLPNTKVSAPQALPKRPLAVNAGHQELYAIGMNIPTIDSAKAMDTGGTTHAPGVRRFPIVEGAGQAQQTGSRWSADAWMLLREGGNGFNTPGAGLPGAVGPTGFYGGSQAGAVLRYRLSLTSLLRPALYLRGTSGLQDPRGEEVAAGFSIRPLFKIPLAVMAEGRVTRTSSGNRVRPAVIAVTELPPAKLPLGLRGEVYAQAGYVGGANNTGFIDGQARIERAVARAGGFELRAGGGVWGGAQKGANRLDAGPTVTLAVPIGPVGARVSADYRIRVGGRAAPGSGAVLTLSAGF